MRIRERVTKSLLTWTVPGWRRALLGPAGWIRAFPTIVEGQDHWTLTLRGQGTTFHLWKPHKDRELRWCNNRDPSNEAA